MGRVRSSAGCWAVALVASGVCLGGMARATTLSDTTGDSASHDVASITGVYNATSWILSAAFAPGTLTPSNLGFLFGLDTDQDINTGRDSSGGTFFPLGAEVSISYHVGLSPTQAQVNVWVPSLASFVLATLVPVTVGTDFLQVVVPRSLTADLGGGVLFPFSDDGLALFGFVTGGLIDANFFAPDDFVPESADNGPLGGPTSSVPELGSLAQGPWLLLAAIAARWARRRRGAARRGRLPGT